MKKQWQYSIPVKLLVMVLTAATLACSVLAVISIAAFRFDDLYGESEEDARKALRVNFGSHFAAQLLEALDIYVTADETSIWFVDGEDGISLVPDSSVAKDFESALSLYEDSESFRYGVIATKEPVDERTLSILVKQDKFFYKTEDFTGEYDSFFESQQNSEYYYDTRSVVTKLLGRAAFYEEDVSASLAANTSEVMSIILLESDWIMDSENGSGEYCIYHGSDPDYTGENGEPQLFYHRYDEDQDEDLIAWFYWSYKDAGGNVFYAFESAEHDFGYTVSADGYPQLAEAVRNFYGDEAADGDMGQTVTGEQVKLTESTDTVTTYTITDPAEAADIAVDADTAATAYAGERTTSSDEVSIVLYDTDRGVPADSLTYYLFYQTDPSAGGDTLLDKRVAEATGIIDSILWFINHTMQIALACLILFIAGMSYLSIAAGRRPNGEKGVLRMIDRLPLEIYLAAVIAVEALGIIALAFWIEQGVSHFPFQMLLFFGFILGLILGFIAIAFLMSVIARCKAKQFVKTTLCYRIIGGLWQFFTKPFRALGARTPVIIKAALILLGLSAAEIIVLLVTFSAYEPGWMMLLFLVHKLVSLPLILDAVSSLIKIRDGARRVAAGTFDEPIDTKRMKGELQRFGEDINHVSDGINAAVAERMKSERMKTELITNVSHDIKTPLTSIINYVDLLQKEKIENPQAKEYMDVLSRQASRLKKLIEDLIEASKAQTGNLEVHPEKCDVGVLLSQVLGEFEDRAAGAGVEIVVNKPEIPINIMADGRYLFRVFDNLMNNICKYALSGTRAYIDLIVRDSTAVITFKNISREQLNISSDELMERFVRGDSSRNTEGNGLGLSIARSLTELMSGDMELNVDGDLFKVTLRFPTT